LGYRPGLDGLRGIAIALVVARHLSPAESRFPGYVGVDVFFVLSGFLITSLLLREWTATNDIAIGSFYRRRLARLYPALAGMLLLFLPIGVLLAGLGAYLLMAGIAATYMTNLVISVSHAVPGPVLHTWSLAQEEQFYLVWPLLLLAALRCRMRKPSIATGLVVMACASWLEPLAVHAAGFTAAFRPDFRVAPMLIGCALALAPMPVTAGRARWPFGEAGAMLLAATIVLWSLGDIHVPIPGALVILTTIATLAMVVDVMARPQSVHSRVLAAWPLRKLGEISYSLYLWHFPIVWALERTHIHPLVRTALATTLCLTAAYASRRWIELPFLRRRDAGSTGEATIRAGRMRRTATPILVE